MTRVTDEDLKKLVAVASNAGESEWRRFMNMHAELLALRKVAQAAVKLEDADVATALQDLAIDSAIRAERRRIRRLIAPARETLKAAALYLEAQGALLYRDALNGVDAIDAATRAPKKARKR